MHIFGPRLTWIRLGLFKAAWICLLLPLASFALEADLDSTFQRARESWLRDRLKDLTRDMILQENLLVFRLESILDEARRTGQLEDAALERLLVENPPHVISEARELGDDGALDERLDFWMARQQEILSEKLELTLEYRRRLISAAPEERRLAMFRSDLGKALQAYAESSYDLAAELFDELIELYPYSNVDDLLFYLGEARLADGAWDSAVKAYHELLRRYPASDYRSDAFRHLLYVRAMFGQHATAVAECKEFSEDLAGASGEIAYLCGREHFLAEQFRAARRILDRVDKSDPAYIKARHLTGLAMILESQHEDAIIVFEELLVLPRKRGFGKDPNALIRADARLKLGYLYFDAGRFAEAAEMFEQAAKGGDRPEALLGQAWSGMSLADHDRALSLSRELVEHYPSSPHRYEAMTLAGFAAEQMDEVPEARDWYGQVLDEAERNEELRELAGERRQVLQMLRQLVEMEPGVFAQDGSASFGQYLDLRRQARILMRRVKYSELQTANNGMQVFVEERQQIIELARQLRTLLDAQADASDAGTRQELASLHRETRQLMNKIRLAGFVEIQRQPLMIHERTLQSVNSMLDSLALSSTAELQHLSRVEAQLDAEPVGGFEQVLYRDRLDQFGERVEKLRSRAGRMKRRPINSNLGRWSELAFSRLAIGDIEFDELQRIEDRLEELDGYLERIDELLQPAEAASAGEQEVQP